MEGIHELYIAGIGMGHPGGMTLEVKDAISRASLLVGGSRMLSSLPEAWKEGKRCVPIWRPEEIAEVLTEAISGEALELSAEALPEDLPERDRTAFSVAAATDTSADPPALVAVALMSGDSGFNSGTTHLLAELSRRGMVAEVNGGVFENNARGISKKGVGEAETRAVVVNEGETKSQAASVDGTPDAPNSAEKKSFSVWICPGIGAISSLAAMAGIGWEEAVPVSLHGRSQNLFAALATAKKVFVLSGGKTNEVMLHLKGSVFRKSQVLIAERMGSAEGRFFRITPEAYEEDVFDPMTTMLILPKAERPVRLLGMADELFRRGNVPMTKSEVRSLTVSRMAVGKSDVVFDIGAGTGSVSVELSMQAMYGRVYAIERKPEALELMRANRERFFCRNLEIVEGVAPEILEGLPTPDAAFIGGSGGELKEILQALKRMNPMLRVGINAAAPETLTAALLALQELSFSNVECSQLCVSRAEPHGKLHLMKAENPVYVISGVGSA